MEVEVEVVVVVVVEVETNVPTVCRPPSRLCLPGIGLKLQKKDESAMKISVRCSDCKRVQDCKRKCQDCKSRKQDCKRKFQTVNTREKSVLVQQ